MQVDGLVPGEVLNAAYFQDIQHFITFCVADRTEFLLFFKEFETVADSVSGLENRIDGGVLFVLKASQRVFDQLVNTAGPGQLLSTRGQAQVLIVKDVSIQLLRFCIK